MDDDMQVDRCDCIGVSFAILKSYGDIASAQKATECGIECGGCLPYLRLMFATGETSFDVDDPRLGNSTG